MSAFPWYGICCSDHSDHSDHFQQIIMLSVPALLLMAAAVFGFGRHALVDACLGMGGMGGGGCCGGGGCARPSCMPQPPLCSGVGGGGGGWGGGRSAIRKCCLISLSDQSDYLFPSNHLLSSVVTSEHHLQTLPFRSHPSDHPHEHCLPTTSFKSISSSDHPLLIASFLISFRSNFSDHSSLDYPFTDQLPSGPPHSDQSAFNQLLPFTSFRSRFSDQFFFPIINF